MIRNYFFELLKTYTSDVNLIVDLWEEIEFYYKNPSRNYHNLDHLNYMLNAILQVKIKILNWDAVMFAIYYHDIIYDIFKNNNEEKSADFAEVRLKKLKLSNQQIDEIKKHILSGKTHQNSENSDRKYFLDADLSILGESPEIYSKYSKNIRAEYVQIPFQIYKTARTNILNDFLNRTQIFLTPYFYQKFEDTARRNIINEIEFLKE